MATGGHASERLGALLVHVGKDLIGAPPERIRERIEAAMGKIADRLGFVWVQLYLFDPDGETATAQCEWSDGTLAPVRRPEGDPDWLVIAEYPWIVEHLSDLEPIRFDVDDARPEFEADARRIAQLGACTSVITPIVDDHALAGVAVFHAAVRLPPLPEGTLEQLQLAADLFTEALSRKRAEERVRDTESRFRLLAESSQEGIVVHEDGVVVDVNAALTRLLGYGRGDMIGRDVRGPWLAPEERGNVERQMQTGFEGVYRTVALHRLGHRVPVEVVGKQLAFGGRRLRVAALRDISGRVRAEVRLRESEDRFRSLVDSVFDGRIIARGDEILEANEGFASMFGYPIEQILDNEREDLATPESAALVRRNGRLGLEEPYDIIGRRSDGAEFPVQILGKACTRGGELVRIIGFRDLTAERRAEQERQAFQDKLRHAQKLESLGVLAGGIAHDFNNLLTAMLGNADLALLEAGDNPRVRRALEQIRTTGERAAELTQQMLDYSGHGRFVLAAVAVDALVKEMAELLEASLPKKVRLSYDFADLLAPVDADAGQLRQVVLNLITNAAEAIGQARGTVALVTRMAELSGDELDVVGDPIPADRYVIVEVTDDGEGMDAETARRIFEPFFTTKFTGRGLGLAAVLGIVRGHRGAIQVDSLRGRGTTVRVLLPATSTPVVPVAAEPPETARVSGLALVVDDEAGVLDVTSMMLEHLGLEVAKANDGREGMDRFLQLADEVDLVVLDLTMPDFNGQEVFERIRAIRADVPVLFCSGFDAPETLHALLARDNVGFVRKPFRVCAMASAVMELLGPAPGRGPE